MDPGETSILYKGIPKALRFSADDKRILKAYARNLTEQLSHSAFTCLITTDRELHKLNKDFLGHDYPTDVLSFPSDNGEAGELAISAQRADAQAQEFGHSRLDELRILMLHGVLHLTGMDHEADRGEMARAERKWRAVFGLPHTLIARAAKSRAKQ